MRKTSTARKPTPKRGAEQKQPTYQDALDEALEETFPASDPIAPGSAAQRVHENTEAGPSEVPSGFAAARSEDLTDIYHALKRGGGRESVNAGNVDALIRMAMQYGDVQLEYLLREWRSDCGYDAGAQKV